MCSFVLQSSFKCNKLFAYFVTVAIQKRLRREKRTRKRLQDQLDLELNRRTQLEDALRNAGAADHIEAINGNSTISN